MEKKIDLKNNMFRKFEGFTYSFNLKKDALIDFSRVQQLREKLYSDDNINWDYNQSFYLDEVNLKFNEIINTILDPKLILVINESLKKFLDVHLYHHFGQLEANYINYACLQYFFYVYINGAKDSKEIENFINSIELYYDYCPDQETIDCYRSFLFNMQDFIDEEISERDIINKLKFLLVESN